LEPNGGADEAQQQQQQQHSAEVEVEVSERQVNIDQMTGVVRALNSCKLNDDNHPKYEVAEDEKQEDDDYEEDDEEEDEQSLMSMNI
jgi:hypothetical protein